MFEATRLATLLLDVEFERMIAVLASVLALKHIHAQLVVKCIYATTVIGNEGPAVTPLLLQCPAV